MLLPPRQSQEDFTNDLMGVTVDSEDDRRTSEDVSDSDLESDQELKEIQEVLAAASVSSTRGATHEQLQEVICI
jgi:hypothetical protein